MQHRLAIVLALATVVLGATLALALPARPLVASSGKRTLLNVSYDPTREFYTEFNHAFAAEWKRQHGEEVEIRQSHGGSGKQARAVIDGLEADVVTLALAHDIDAIHEHGKLLPADWQLRLPHASAPYTSTIVFVVRNGNPKGIAGWDDLVKPGIQVITPNPKTSGGARWNYLAAWGHALKAELGDLGVLNDPARKADVERAETRARAFIAALFKNVPVLDSGARGSTTTFAQRGLGDVFLSWENEAFLIQKEFASDGFEIVVPQTSIQAEPSVAVVDAVVDRHKTRDLAEAYLHFLYAPAGQRVAARHFFRPRDRASAAKDDLARFAKLDLFTIETIAGSWREAQARHFADGGEFDVLYRPGE